MRNRSVLLLLAMANLALGESDATRSGRGIEFGTAVGSPAGLNLVLGYWSDSSVPLVLRTSGMYYGGLRGIQGDIGWVLEFKKNFRQIVCLSAAASHIEYSDNPLPGIERNVDFTGAGPFYEVAFDDWSFGGGLFVGRAKGAGVFPFVEYSGADKTTVQLQLQIGYKNFWEF